MKKDQTPYYCCLIFLTLVLNQNIKAMQDIEIWKDIPGYEGYYQASDQGRIKSLHQKRGFETISGEFFIKGELIKKGYLRAAFYKDGKRKRILFHNVVMDVFDGPSHLLVDHINTIKTDNRLLNLRRCTNRQNRIWYWEGRPKKVKSVGVTVKKNRYRSRIIIKGKEVVLGYFDNETDASDAYRNAVNKLTP